jgi:membrane protease YdiL (CAAX protease family)
MTDIPISQTEDESGPPSEGTPGNWFVTASVAAVGIAVVFSLFRYNVSGATVWYSGRIVTSRSWDEYLLVNVTWLLLPAFVLILGFLRDKPEHFGLRPPESGSWKLAGIFFLAMAPILIFASRRPDFYSQYPLFPEAGRTLTALAFHEFTYGFYLLCWEFFFRGFLTFGLSRALGATKAVLLQAVAFGIMHYGKPMPEFYSSFAGGLILGWMALRYRSFFPGFVLHWAVSGAMDILAIHAKPNGMF